MLSVHPLESSNISYHMTVAELKSGDEPYPDNVLEDIVPVAWRAQP